MPRKLKIVNAEGRIVSFEGNLLIFDLDKRQIDEMDERERAETILMILQNNSAEELRLVEFEE